MLYVDSLEQRVQRGELAESEMSTYDAILDTLWWEMDSVERDYVQQLIATDKYKEIIDAV